MARRGLVLSGGAALGAYQAGVLRALHEAGVEFEVISATSIGTINGAAWNIPEVVGELHDHWFDNVRELKPFDPGQVLRRKNPFRFHLTLDALVENYRARYPFDNERAELLVTVADYETHQVQTFSTSDTSIPQADRENLMKASTAILHIGSEPVAVQGRLYYDGGYYNNVPIEPLLERDLDEIWVVPLTPIAPLGKTIRRPSLNLLKKAMPSPYTYSLFSFVEQISGPPCMNRGTAQKIIISPFETGSINTRGLGQSLLFSLKGIQKLLDADYRDAAQVIAQYRG